MTTPTPTNPCLTCDARCCRRYAIYVVPADIRRIAAHLGRPAADFVTAETADLAPELPVVYLDGRPSQLALASVPGGEDCVFVDPDTRRCTIHDHAPYVCRMYPHTVAGEHEPRIRLKNTVLCPDPFPLDDNLSGELLELSMGFWNVDVQAYRLAAQRWNLGGAEGGLDAFLAFCLDPD